MDGSVSCVAMLEPLLLTQVLADAGNECQPNPDPGVAYIESAWKFWDHISSFFFFFLFALVHWAHTCVVVSSGITPCALRHASASCLFVHVSQMCMCVRVMSFALSCHFTCRPAIGLGFPVAAWVGESRCHVDGDPSKHRQRCVWPTAYNCQFVTSLGLALTLDRCDTGLGVSRKHDMASAEPGVGAKCPNTKWAFAVTDHFATCPPHRHNLKS